MKKVICIILLLIFCTIALTGCVSTAEWEYTSLPEYIEHIKLGSHSGHSSWSLDNPAHLLPSVSFFDEYSYIEGGYYCREHSIFGHPSRPELSIIYLRYNDSVYLEAKENMLEKIAPYNNKFYEYNNYIFYRNSNQIALEYDAEEYHKKFPLGRSTYACYNDENHTLIFLGIYTSHSTLDQKYIEDIEGNWMDFIDQYYGEYYDFSK